VPQKIAAALFYGLFIDQIGTEFGKNQRHFIYRSLFKSTLEDKVTPFCE